MENNKITNNIHNGNKLWTMISSEYLKAAITVVEDKLTKNGKKLPNKLPTQLEDSKELENSDITYYQELIGILQWSTEIGHFIILYKVSIMSLFQALLRRGHLQHVLHIFGYTSKRIRSRKYVCWNITPELCDDSFGVHLYVELVVSISHVHTVVSVPV